MANPKGFKIHVDSFLTDTRVIACFNTNCIYNRAAWEGEFECNLKKIEINEEGNCIFKEEISDDKGEVPKNKKGVQ